MKPQSALEPRWCYLSENLKSYGFYRAGLGWLYVNGSKRPIYLPPFVVGNMRAERIRDWKRTVMMMMMRSIHKTKFEPKNRESGRVKKKNEIIKRMKNN